MRPDELYLLDMLTAAEATARFLDGVDQQTFLGDEVLQSAVLHQLTVIGESAARISAELREAHSDIEWRAAVGLRNVVVHQYFAISWETIWWTASRDVPKLSARIRVVLRALGGDQAEDS